MKHTYKISALAIALASAFSTVSFADISFVRVKAATLPNFQLTPNIAAAVSSAFGSTPVVRALYATQSGFQIYRCDRNAAQQPTWLLRTPLTQLAPRQFTPLLVRPVSNSYHILSNFGGLVNDAELSAMGLLSADGIRANAPVWQFTFTEPNQSPLTATGHRETVAGRVIAQDTVVPTDIPWFLIEVRGRAVSTLTSGVTTNTTNLADPRTNPIAASEYLLRFNTKGGVAPSAATCSESTIGSESQQAYSSDYYFVDIDPPTL